MPEIAFTTTSEKKITSLCKKHGIYVSTGGFIERVIIQGSSAVDKYLRESKRLGFNVVEISSGFADISMKNQVEIIKKVRNLGMKAKPEISFMKGAGGGTQIANYKPQYKDVNTLLENASAYLDAGAYMLMLESEGITEDIPESKWRKDIIKKAIDRFGLEKMDVRGFRSQGF